MRKMVLNKKTMFIFRKRSYIQAHIFLQLTFSDASDNFLKLCKNLYSTSYPYHNTKNKSWFLQNFISKLILLLLTTLWFLETKKQCFIVTNYFCSTRHQNLHFIGAFRQMRTCFQYILMYPCMRQTLIYLYTNIYVCGFIPPLRCTFCCCPTYSWWIHESISNPKNPVKPNPSENLVEPSPNENVPILDCHENHSVSQ